jgi:hypothetical protein
MEIIDVIMLVVCVISLIVAIFAIILVNRLKRKLNDEYWSKDVVGRTINAKTGNDVVGDQKEQDKALGKSKPKPEPPSFVKNPIDDVLKES